MPDAIRPGQVIRAEFTAKVTSRASQPNGSSEVEDSKGFTHFLYLAGPSRREILTSGDSARGPRAGDTITVAFTAKTTSRLKGLLGTTLVRTAGGADHALNLSSPLVTVTAPPEEAPVMPVSYKPVPYAPGQEIRAEFTAEVIARSAGPLSTSEVRETESGAIHFLYLAPGTRREILSGDPLTLVPGDIITVAFTATVGTFEKKAPPGTTAVTVGTPNPYFLDLTSPSIRAVPSAITPDDDLITSAHVIARLAGLRARKAALVPRYTLTRNRNNTLEGTFPSLAEATAYLDKEDLAPARFTLSQVASKLSPAEAAELAGLTDLDLLGRRTFGGKPWDFGGVELRPGRYYGTGWARNLAITRLGLTASQLNDWPLSLIPWTTAARDELTQNYRGVLFGTTQFYGRIA